MNVIKETRRWLPAEGEFSELNLTVGDVILSRSEYEALKEDDDLRNRIFCAIAPAVISGLMLRHKEPGYDDPSAIAEGIRLTLKELPFALAELEGGENEDSHS